MINQLKDHKSNQYILSHSFHGYDLSTFKNLWVINDLSTQAIIHQIRQIHQENNPYYGLVYGPQGCGKSHFLCLLKLQLRLEIDVDDMLEIITIGQHQWELNRYSDWLIHLLSQLKNKEQISEFNQLIEIENDKKLIQLAEQQLSQYLKTHKMLIIFDQLDLLCERIGIQGQKSLQKLLKQQRNLSVIASANHEMNLIDFDNLKLSPLNLTQSQQLLLAHSKINQNPKLEAFWTSNTGSLYAQALNHLLGGNAKRLVDFCYQLELQPIETRAKNHISNSKTNEAKEQVKEGLDFKQLTSQIMKMIDRHIDTYHQKMALLPPQQRQIIQYLCSQACQHRGAVTVGQIAKRLRVTHQTASGQLKKLRDQQKVIATKVGRESQYEISHPFETLTLSLSSLATDSDSNPVHTSIAFSQHWFACLALNLPSLDQQCFVVNKQWLCENYLPMMLPLVVKLKHRIDNYLQQLQQGNNDGFAALREKLLALSDNIINSPFAQQQKSTALAHSELLHGLICRHISSAAQNTAIPLAKTLWQDLYDFVVQLKQPAIWQQLAEQSVKQSALYAVHLAPEEITPMLAQLEPQESELHSLAFSIQISHMLVYKAYGYTQIDDKLKTQQCLEQLRMRADKRNSPQIAGAYCHGVKHCIFYIAKRDERLAAKLVKQVQDLNHKYRHFDLLFACQCRLWAANPELISLDQVMRQLDKVYQLDNFNAEIYQLLATCHHTNHYQQLFSRLVEYQCIPEFSAALTLTAVNIAKDQPSNYLSWLNQLLPLSQVATNGDKVSLNHAWGILKVIGQYVESQDINQLLQIPMLERRLLLTQLVTTEAID